MKYKVGDKVRIRKDLIDDKIYGEDMFVKDMKKYSGKIMTVDKIVKECKYQLKEDTQQWHWTDEMLEEECKPYSWLKEDITYYFPNVEKNDLYDCFQYNNDEIDERLISRGIIFKTKEEAIEVAKKMLEVVK